MGDLIEQNAGMIFVIAKRYRPAAERHRGADMDDLTQAATLGMIEAVPRWDEQRGAFLTVATFYMRHELRQLLGIQKAKAENAEQFVSLSLPIGDDAELWETLTDEHAADPQENACTNNLREIIREAVDELPQEQREAVKGFYLERNETTPNQYQRKKGLETLSRKASIRTLADEYHARAYRHIGAQTFRTTRTSAVEAAAMAREDVYTWLLRRHTRHRRN